MEEILKHLESREDVIEFGGGEKISRPPAVEERLSHICRNSVVFYFKVNVLPRSFLCSPS